MPAEGRTKRPTPSRIVFRSDRILEEVTRQLRNDRYWLDAVKACKGGKPSNRLHLAVFVEPYLNYILEGKKKVESRFSVNRVSPHWQVTEGDVILLKEASGPIVGISAVLRSWTYEIDRASLEGIKRKFERQLYVDDPQFWIARRRARYATLILLAKARAISPISISKTDRRGWVVLSGARSFQTTLLND